jgi:hypothetical protein
VCFRCASTATRHLNSSPLYRYVMWLGAQFKLSTRLPLQSLSFISSSLEPGLQKMVIAPVAMLSERRRPFTIHTRKTYNPRAC